MESKIDNFKNTAPKIFQTLIDNYDYILEDIKINRLNDMDWSVNLTYINQNKGLKIVIKQEPYYTDYGFSFEIHKLGTDEYNILCNVEHDKQDSKNMYLLKAYRDLFSTQEILDIISGKYWKEFDHILFKT